VSWKERMGGRRVDVGQLGCAAGDIGPLGPARRALGALSAASLLTGAARGVQGVGSYSDMSASDMLNYKSAAYRKPRDSNGVPGGLQIRDPFAKKDRRRSSGGSSGSASPDKRKGAALKAVGFSNFI